MCTCLILGNVTIPHLACEPSKKIKQSLSSGDCPSVHTAAVVDDVIAHADYATEEYEVADEASPKKSTEVLLSDGGGEFEMIRTIAIQL